MDLLNAILGVLLVIFVTVTLLLLVVHLADMIRTLKSKKNTYTLDEFLESYYKDFGLTAKREDIINGASMISTVTVSMSIIDYDVQKTYKLAHSFSGQSVFNTWDGTTKLINDLARDILNLKEAEHDLKYQQIYK